MKKWVESHRLNCQCGACTGSYTGFSLTKYEKIALDKLFCDFPVVITQRWFGGKYRVDFYIPKPYHIAFEIDGIKHDHPKGRSKDQIRDAWLFENFGLPIVRISNKEIEDAVRSE